MTPEARAALVVHHAAELGLVTARADGAKWHSLIATAITDALVEARGVIGDLMVGSPAPPASYPVTVVCHGCAGLGHQEPNGSLPCPVCNGTGKYIDHGPPPSPNPGLMAVKPCGCAVDWVGTGAPDEYRQARVSLWAAQGYISKTVDFLEAGPLITRGAACAHDRRATPRAGTDTVLDLSDTPPGGGG